MKITGISEHPVVWMAYSGMEKCYYQRVGCHQFVEITDENGNKYIVDVDVQHQAVSRNHKDFGGSSHVDRYFTFMGPIGICTLYYTGVGVLGVGSCNHVFKGKPELHHDFWKYVERKEK